MTEKSEDKGKSGKCEGLPLRQFEEKQRVCYYTFLKEMSIFSMERCVSGLNGRPGKSVYQQWYREFESRLLRQIERPFERPGRNYNQC